MIDKIYQTIVSDKNGNCMQAALATMFGRSLDETINVWDYGESEWVNPVIEWLELQGFEYDGTMGCGPFDGEWLLESLSKCHDVNGVFFASVPSKTFKNCQHAVLIDRNGIVVHDPNPNERWLGIDTIKTGELINFYSLIPITTDKSEPN